VRPTLGRLGVGVFSVRAAALLGRIPLMRPASLMPPALVMRPVSVIRPAFAMSVLMASCAALAMSIATRSTAADERLDFFERKIRPVLVKACYD